MLFKVSPAVTLTGVLAALAFANPEPQSPAQSSQVIADLASYVLALPTDPAFISLVSVLQTDPAGLSSVQAFESSIASVISAGQTIASDYLSVLPTEAQSFFGSVVTAELSIASQDGFTTSDGTAAQTSATSATATSKSTTSGTIAGTAAGSATSTKSGNGAPTTAALGLSAAALGGFVGVVMAM